MWELLSRNTLLTIVVIFAAYIGWFVSLISQLFTGSQMSAFRSASIVTTIIGVGLATAFGLT